jgi:hypothetical protein
MNQQDYYQTANLNMSSTDTLGYALQPGKVSINDRVLAAYQQSSASKKRLKSERVTSNFTSSAGHYNKRKTHI